MLLNRSNRGPVALKFLSIGYTKALALLKALKPLQVVSLIYNTTPPFKKSSSIT